MKKPNDDFRDALARHRQTVELTIAYSVVDARKRELRQLRRLHGTCELDHAADLAESIGYDTSAMSGHKAIAYLMRTTPGAVRNLLEPPPMLDLDEDEGDDNLNDFLAGL